MMRGGEKSVKQYIRSRNNSESERCRMRCENSGTLYGTAGNRKNGGTAEPSVLSQTSASGPGTQGGESD